MSHHGSIQYVESGRNDSKIESMIKELLNGQKKLQSAVEASTVLPKKDDVAADDSLLLLSDVSTLENGQMIEAMDEIRENISVSGENWRRKAKHVARSILLTNLVLSTSWGSLQARTLVSVLSKISALGSLFKNDEDALWIVVSIHRLQLQLLYYISYHIIEKGKSCLKDSLSDLQEALGVISAANEHSRLVTGKMLQEAATGVQSMLVDHARNVGAAAFDLVWGGAKSLLTMQVDARLIRGLCGAAVAGFEMFKHHRASDQFSMISLLDPMRELTQPMVPYDKLVEASMVMDAMSGNWLLTACYLNNLMKIAYCAFRNLGKPSNSEADNAECLRVVYACVVGDGTVLSINKLLQKVCRRRRTMAGNIAGKGADVIGNAVLNAESLGGLLRSITMEATGELMESIQHFAVDRIAVLQDPLLKSTLESLAKSVDVSSEQAAEGVLDQLQQISDVLAEIKEWITLFEKSIKKVIGHVQGLIKCTGAVLHYWDMFQGAASADMIEAEVEKVKSIRSQGSSVEPDFLEFMSKLDDAYSSQDKLRVMIGVTRQYLQSSVSVLETMLKSFETSTALAEKYQKLQAVIERETDRQKKRKFPVSSKWNIAKWNTDVGSLDNFLRDATELVKSIDETLCKQINKAFSDNELELSHLCAQFRLCTEVASRVEDMFGELSVSSTGAIGAVQGVFVSVAEEAKFVERLEDKVVSGVKQLKDVAKDCLTGIAAQAVGGSWLTTVSDLWSSCSGSAGAMSMVRESVQVLVGPGRNPELVEEAAMAAVLDLDIIATMLAQTRIDVTATAGKSQTTGGSLTKPQLDRFTVIQESLAKRIALAKSSSANGNVQALLSQSKHKAKVGDVLRKSWQSIEDAVMQGNLANASAQQALAEALHGDDELDKKPEMVYTVRQVMDANHFDGEVSATIGAAEELSVGQGGVAGLAPGLLKQLYMVKRGLDFNRASAIAIVEKAVYGSNSVRDPTTIYNTYISGTNDGKCASKGDEFRLSSLHPNNGHIEDTTQVLLDAQYLAQIIALEPNHGTQFDLQVLSRRVAQMERTLRKLLYCHFSRGSLPDGFEHMQVPPDPPDEPINYDAYGGSGTEDDGTPTVAMTLPFATAELSTALPKLDEIRSDLEKLLAKADGVAAKDSRSAENDPNGNVALYAKLVEIESQLQLFGTQMVAPSTKRK